MWPIVVGEKLFSGRTASSPALRPATTASNNGRSRENRSEGWQVTGGNFEL